ncbi:hypothetical protein SAMN04515671_2902 [Nakamurella panacisegetis]|uniref:Uncharacterized protein n=1 Tax=Nakamurella panacisegetis TaxID=1090615 RepID=A0A1H0PVF8_9ACTN|nr:hypothetical protein [Nakamurella panacisegetis]SDP08489.1 hypothetical protein SAMN04515671_2902 [Nakamurella panacisegetis]
MSETIEASTPRPAWEQFITPKMEADARRQALRLVNAGGYSLDAAAAEAAAWVRMKAIQAMQIAGLAK